MPLTYNANKGFCVLFIYLFLMSSKATLFCDQLISLQALKGLLPGSKCNVFLANVGSCSSPLELNVFRWKFINFMVLSSFSNSSLLPKLKSGSFASSFCSSSLCLRGRTNRTTQCRLCWSEPWRRVALSVGVGVLLICKNAPFPASGSNEPGKEQPCVLVNGRQELLCRVKETISTLFNRVWDDLPRLCVFSDFCHNGVMEDVVNQKQMKLEVLISLSSVSFTGKYSCIDMGDQILCTYRLLSI